MGTELTLHIEPMPLQDLMRYILNMSATFKLYPDIDIRVAAMMHIAYTLGRVYEWGVLVNRLNTDVPGLSENGSQRITPDELAHAAKSHENCLKALARISTNQNDAMAQRYLDTMLERIEEAVDE